MPEGTEDELEGVRCMISGHKSSSSSSSSKSVVLVVDEVPVEDISGSSDDEKGLDANGSPQVVVAAYITQRIGELNEHCARL